MDKYEYKLKTEQMLKLMENGAYNRAAEIADSIDWKRVRNVNMLLNVSNIYEKIRDYRKSFGVLRAAYHRTEGSRKILYRLCTLAIKVGNLEEAIDYYDEYVQAAPKDPNQYILRYRLLRARRAPIEQQIRALEQFKKAEYVEEWAYELAKRYEEAGMTAECLEECDDLILWFSEGKYVYKAMELKMRYKPLTPLQQEKYDRRLEEAEKSSERAAEKLIDLGRIKAEEEEKRRREQEEAARYTEDMLERSEQIAEPENAELSEEEVAEQLKKAEPPKKKLGDTMKLGEALQNLFHTEKEEAQEQEELELSEEDAEEYEEDIEELAEEDAEPVEGDDEESTGEDDCSDLAEALEEIESLSDLELLDQVTEEEPVEEIIEETIETKVKEVDLKELEELAEPEVADAADVEVIEEPEVAEEAEKEDMEKESIKLEETEIKEDERIDEPVDDILDIDDILAEWEAAEGSTVGELLDVWAEEELKTGTLSNGTVENYLGAIRCIKKHPIADRKLKTVTAEHLQAFLDLLTFGGEFPDGKVKKGYSKDYIHSFSAVLQQSFRFAVFPKQLISFNPMQYIKLKKQAEEVDLFSDDEVEEGTQPISHEDYERLIQYLEKKNPPAILPIQIAYYAGLRIGETCGLTWQDINLEEQCLTIKRSIRYDGMKHKNIIGPTKRKKVRIVDFGDTLTEILKAARKEQLKNRMQYGELYHRNYYKEVHVKNRVYYEYYHLDGTQEVPTDYKEISFVCLRPDGSLELPSTLSIVCRSVAKKLEGFEDFHFHQLRHTYTSNLLSNGAAPKDVQELLGHSDVSTTMNIYAHSTRKAKRDSARLLDKVASNA